MKKASPEHLIEEYKVAQQKVELHNRIAWQIGGIFIAGVVAGFSVFASKLGEIDDCTDLIGLFFAGTFSIVIFELWFRIYRRWGTYVQISHHRAQEIEKVLGLRLNLNIDLFDIELKRDKQREQKLDKDDAQRLQQLIKWFAKRRLTPERTPVHSSVKAIKCTIVVGWIVLFITALLQYLCKIAVSTIISIFVL